MLIGSEKSPLNSSDSSCAKAFLAITGRVLLVYMYVEKERESELTLKSLLYVDGFLCTGLKVWNLTFGLAKGHGSF